jgi:hypothetical protein
MAAQTLTVLDNSRVSPAETNTSGAGRSQTPIAATPAHPPPGLTPIRVPTPPITSESATKSPTEVPEKLRLASKIAYALVAVCLAAIALIGLKPAFDGVVLSRMANSYSDQVNA